jgi:hypothetical protein
MKRRDSIIEDLHKLRERIGRAMTSMPIASPRPSANTNMRRVALSLRQRQNLRSVRPGLAVDELPNNAMEPSARELTLARRGSSRR